MSRDFNQLLESNWKQRKFLCVGLDPDLEKIPTSIWGKNVRERFIAFDRAIIDATKDIVCAYKPNTAFYEAHGDEGIRALRETCSYILDQSPEAIIILDAKRADIGNTNRGYVDFAFKYLRCDAITLHPYLGAQALKPFLARKDKGSFILCRTSNPGAEEFQDFPAGNEPLYMRVAERVTREWNAQANCGLVVGATSPRELANVRSVAPDMPILIPGIGTQGGDIAAAVAAAKNARGGFLLSASRSILYASHEADFAEAARKMAKTMDDSAKIVYENSM